MSSRWQSPSLGPVRTSSWTNEESLSGGLLGTALWIRNRCDFSSPGKGLMKISAQFELLRFAAISWHLSFLGQNGDAAMHEKMSPKKALLVTRYGSLRLQMIAQLANITKLTMINYDLEVHCGLWQIYSWVPRGFFQPTFASLHHLVGCGDGDNHPGINKPRSSHVLSLVDKLTIKHLSTQTRNKPSLVMFIHFRILVLPCLWWLMWLNVVVKWWLNHV